MLLKPPVTDAAPGPGVVRRWLVPRRDGLGKRLGYALLGLPLGVLYAGLFAGLVASAILAVYGVGIVLILVVLMLVRGFGGWERGLARRLLGSSVPESPVLRRERGLVRRLRLLVVSASTWRTVAWLGVRVLVASAVLTTLGLAVTVAWLLLTYPTSLQIARGLPMDLLVLSLIALTVLAVVRAIDLATRLLALIAPTLLGVSAEQRIATLRRVSARLAGRTTVARDLHDTIGHALTASLVQAEAAQRALSAGPSGPVDLDFARQALGHIEENTRQALGELDRALAVLGDSAPIGTLDERPPDLSDVEGLLAGLGDAGLPLELTMSVAPMEVPVEASRLAYRVIQEGTTNVLRHAGLAPTLIEASRAENGVVVRVRNAAGARVPARPGPGGGYGLAGLRDRAAELGGTVTAGPTVDGGFELLGELPIGRAHA